jgi:peptide/nickel transport system permease protein
VLTLIIRRLAISVPLIFVVSILVFVLEALTPGNAARALLGAGGTPEQYAALRRQLGLDQPLYQQYWHYIDRVLHGSFGTSIFTGQPVTTVLNARLPTTLSLIILSTVLAAVVGILLGTISAVRGGVIGRIVDVVSVAGLALPNFWLGLILVVIFSIDLHLFPAIGYTSLLQSPVEWIRSLVLPVVALSLAGVAGIAKTTRDSMLEIMNRDFIRTLRANGVSARSIIWKHALKNAAIPVVSIMNVIFISALSGTIFIESVFVLPGLGSLIVTAVTNHDIYEIEGVAIYFTLIVIAVNLIIDVAYGWLNPRVRAG